MRRFVTPSLLIFSLSLFSCSKSNEADLQAVDPQLSSAVCNTANMKFSTDIAPILQANCNSCHNASIRFGNIRTDNFSSVKMIADNGRLVGTITHASGFSPMPQGAAKLADCDINKIKAWVAQGTINN